MTEESRDSQPSLTGHEKNEFTVNTQKETRLLCWEGYEGSCHKSMQNQQLFIPSSSLCGLHFVSSVTQGSFNPAPITQTQPGYKHRYYSLMMIYRLIQSSLTSQKTQSSKIIYIRGVSLNLLAFGYIQVSDTVLLPECFLLAQKNPQGKKCN